MDRNALISLYERYAGTAGGVLALVLAIVCGSLVARLAWGLMPAPPDAWSASPVERDSRSAQDDSGYDLERLVSTELFGRYEPPAEADEPEEVEQSIEDAPETRLSLKLLGVWAVDEPALSRAIIAVSNQDEAVFAIDDEISSGVKLHSILADRVIISRGGTLETLRMEREAVAGVEQRASTRQQTRAAGRGTGEAIEAQDPQQLGEIRNELLQDPSQAGNYIRVVPASSGGQQRGYRIYPGRDRSLFSAAGLRPGDLVTAVNGVELNDPARALQLLNELSNADSINVTVERGGSTQNYVLSTN